jgi:hypothetical protein
MASIDLKVWWHAATIFLYFYIIRADKQYLFILFVEYPFVVLMASAW